MVVVRAPAVVEIEERLRVLGIEGRIRGRRRGAGAGHVGQRTSGWSGFGEAKASEHRRRGAPAERRRVSIAGAKRRGAERAGSEHRHSEAREEPTNQARGDDEWASR